MGIPVGAELAWLTWVSEGRGPQNLLPRWEMETQMSTESERSQWLHGEGLRRGRAPHAGPEVRGRMEPRRPSWNRRQHLNLTLRQSKQLIQVNRGKGGPPAGVMAPAKAKAGRQQLWSIGVLRGKRKSEARPRSLPHPELHVGCFWKRAGLGLEFPRIPLR